MNYRYSLKSAGKTVRNIGGTNNIGRKKTQTQIRHKDEKNAANKKKYGLVYKKHVI
jgi:ribosomal protein L35